MRNPALQSYLAERGIIIPELLGDFDDKWLYDFKGAMDAQPVLATVSNAGIPSYLSNWVDPKFIDILFAPMRAAEIFGEEKKGDWTTMQAMFPVIESTGEVSSYGDHSNSGSTGANVNFPQRQAYLYQTISQWGELEIERAGLARLDWVSAINRASALTLNKFQNASYFFGIAGLQNYGILNDPNLYAPISPTGAWTTASDGGLIYEDVRRLFAQLQTQCNGTIDDRSKMKLVMSPAIQTTLAKTNQYGINVRMLLKENYPNMTLENAVEYNVPISGQLVQLIVEEIDGQKTLTPAFNEKMRAHAIIRDLSSFKQKKTQGTFGAVIYRTFGIAQMQPIV